MSTSMTSRTEEQEKQTRRMFEDLMKSSVELALRKVNPDKGGLQRLLEQGNEIGSEMNDFVIAQFHGRSVANQFVDEEVASSYGYLSGYKPKGVTTQTNILRELIPGVGYADEKLAEQILLPNAEGWFAIPRWESVAPTYGEAVEKVFELIKKTRHGKFYNYREGQLGPQNLRQSGKSARAWATIGEARKGHNILLVQAQFGLLHRGRSVRRAREVMYAGQFGLGAFAIGIMLLTHPERLQHYDDLWIDCAGDEYSSEADGGFGLAPCFDFIGGGVEFDARRVADADDDFGSASAFLPQ